MTPKGSEIEQVITNSLAWDTLLGAVEDCKLEAEDVEGTTKEDLKLAFNSLISDIIDEIR
jgi:hypothetical protein